MSRNGSITLAFAGEERFFRLGWRELIELQEARDAGPAYVLGRLAVGAWHVQDVREVIRLGLQGGGVSQADAIKLVRTHVEQCPENFGGSNGLLVLATRILSAAIDGAPDEPLGETDAPATAPEPTTCQTEKSESGRSTPQPH